MEELDLKYNSIMHQLKYLMQLIGLEREYINNKLDNSELSQSDLDSFLIDLIETIKSEVI